MDTWPRPCSTIERAARPARVPHVLPLFLPTSLRLDPAKAGSCMRAYPQNTRPNSSITENTSNPSRLVPSTLAPSSPAHQPSAIRPITPRKLALAGICRRGPSPVVTSSSASSPRPLLVLGPDCSNRRQARQTTQQSSASQRPAASDERRATRRARRKAVSSHVCPRPWRDQACSSPFQTRRRPPRAIGPPSPRVHLILQQAEAQAQARARSTSTSLYLRPRQIIQCINI